MLTACLTLIALVQPVGPPPRVERLDNGLRVVIVEDHTLPLVSVQLWYRVGSAYDDPENPGLCHVTRTILEHRDDAALRLRAAGVRFESRTLRDADYFASVLPPNFLEYVLKIEAERMRPLKTTPEMVATGLAAAARDFGLKPDDPEQLAERQLLAAMFSEHPYQHPPGLVAETLSGLEPDDVDEFLQRWFVAGNATMLIIGDVSDVATMELVRKQFAALPWAEPPRRVELPSPEAAQIHLPAVAAEQTGVDIAWLTPPAGYFENAALDVLMHRLCNPVDGPLHLRLTEAGCFPPRWRREAWRDHGLLVLSVDWAEEEGNEATRQQGNKGSVGVSAGRVDRLQTGPTANVAAGLRAGRSAPTSTPEQIERAVREELSRAAETIPSEIELNRARALAGRDVMLRRASFSKRALRLAWHEMVTGDLLLADFEHPRVAGANVADVQEAAALLLRAHTIVRPRQRSSEPVETSTIQGIASLVTPLRAEPPTQLDSAAALKLLARHAENAPPVVSPKVPAAVTTHELDNGVRVTVCLLPNLELVEVRTLGQPAYPVSKVAEAAMALGSTHRSVDQIRDYVSYHGLDICPSSLRTGRGGLRSSTPVARVPQIIELHAELLRQVNQSGVALETAAERGRALRRWLPDALPDEDGGVYLPPGFIGWHIGITPAAEVEGLEAKLSRLSDLRDVQVLVVGNVSPQEVVEAVKLVWGDWRPAADMRKVKRSRDRGTSQPAVPPRITSLWSTDSTVPRTIMVSMDFWPLELDPPARELVTQWTAWSLGKPCLLPRTLDDERSWLWGSLRILDCSVMLIGNPVDYRLSSAIGECLEHLQQVRLGMLPRRQADQALRMARVDRLLTLDSAAHIADMLERDLAAPWDLADSGGVYDVQQMLRRALRVRSLSVVGIGPEDRSAVLQQFESPPEPPATQPYSP